MARKDIKTKVKGNNYKSLYSEDGMYKITTLIGTQSKTTRYMQYSLKEVKQKFKETQI
jgi:hypothetical protein